MPWYGQSLVINETRYESQQAHEWRIAREQDKLEKATKLSRSRAPRMRRDLLLRSGHRCEICKMRLVAILNMHHIFPVRRSGASSMRNMVIICPNCHAAIHYVERGRKKYSMDARKQKLVEAGYTEEQAELIRVIATHDAHVSEDGVIESYTDPPEMPVVIIDGPNVTPEQVALYDKKYDRVCRAAEKSWQNSHCERGRRMFELMKAGVPASEITWKGLKV